jgi:hypothetical protein
MPLISILVIALMIGALIDVITRDDSQVKHLPKMVWVIIVILLPLIGSALWFALGREYAGGGMTMPRMPRREAPPRSQRAPATQTWSSPVEARSTEQQIADLDREIEEWELRQQIEARRRERGEADPA